jgi:hypothetical protein
MATFLGVRPDVDSDGVYGGESATAALAALATQLAVMVTGTVFAVTLVLLVVWVARDYDRLTRRLMVLVAVALAFATIAYQGAVAAGGEDYTAPTSMRELWLMNLCSLFYVAATVNMALFRCVRLRSVVANLSFVLSGGGLLSLVLLGFEIQYGTTVDALVMAALLAAASGLAMLLPVLIHSRDLDGVGDELSVEFENAQERRNAAVRLQHTPPTPSPRTGRGVASLAGGIDTALGDAPTAAERVGKND